MQLIDYPGVGMTNVHYLHDLIWGIWRLTSLSGLSPDLEDTHIYIFMGNFKSDSEETFMEAGESVLLASYC